MKRIKKVVWAGVILSLLSSVSFVNAKDIPYKKPGGFDFAFDESIKYEDGRDPYIKNYYSKEQRETWLHSTSYDPQYVLNKGYTAKLNKWMSLKAGKGSILGNVYKLNIPEPSILTVQIANPQPKTWTSGGSNEDFCIMPMNYASGVFVDINGWADISTQTSGSFIDADPARAAEKVKNTYTKGLAYVKGDAVLSLESVTSDIPVQMKISSYPLSHNTKLKLNKTYTRIGKKAHFGIYRVKIVKDSKLTIKHGSENNKTHFFMWNSKYVNYNPMLSDIRNTIHNEPQAYIGKKSNFKVKAGTYYFVAETIKDDKYSFKMTAKPLKKTKQKISKRKKAAK